MGKIRGKRLPEGHVRQSQVIRTFGPGAFLDLPEHSVLVGGLDDWMGVEDEIQETRLIEKLKRLFNPPLTALKLCQPPPEDDDRGGAVTGIPAWQFPEWFVTRNVLVSETTRGIRSRRLVHRKALTGGEYIDEDRKKHPVVPVRFVRACSRGHIGDIHWPSFVHKGKSTCPGELWQDESGTTGDINEIAARCGICGQSRRLGEAYNPEMMALGICDGYRPWLGPCTQEKCGEPNRVLDRTASNAYFPQVMSVISLPDRYGSLEKAVKEIWTLIHRAASPEHINVSRSMIDSVQDALKGFTDEEVYKEVLAQKGFSAASPTKSVKQVEIEVLAAALNETEGDVPDGTFFARSYPRKHWEETWTKKLEQVVLVHRLREVAAQVGFTRFDPSSADIDGELTIGAEMAPLAREIKFLPAVENRGEGIFLGFKKEGIASWLEKETVKARGKQLRNGFECWREVHPKSAKKFPGLPYIMLHSLSHMLITAMSLECGYPASAIRERVYTGESGHGILLFTGTPDSEGTMGGLIEAGRRISRHLRAALELGGLCSSDPVCAQHEASDAHENRFLHGASCHGCLLIAETSCEQFNDFLDRALVVPTVAHLGAEFFEL